jgi:hypothetical protein
LVRTGECVLAQPEIGAPELPIWPATFSLVGDELRRQGVLVARIGDTVKLGGGEYKWEQQDFLAGLLVAPIPAACDRGPYWMVSELER